MTDKQGREGRREGGREGEGGGTPPSLAMNVSENENQVITANTQYRGNKSRKF